MMALQDWEAVLPSTLTSFQEVEDNLTAQSVLKTEAEQQCCATARS